MGELLHGCSFTLVRTSLTGMELLLFCLRFTFSAGYSMSLVLSRSKCLVRNSACIRSNDRIMECIDKCLINFKMGCRFLQWDTETHACFRYKNVLRDYHGSGVCLSKSKDLGTGMVDKRCAVFTVGSANAFGRKRMYLPPHTPLNVCLRKMISTSQFYELYCDLQGVRPCCLKLLDGYIMSRVGVVRNVIKVSQTEKCNERKSHEEMCTRSIASKRMKGGIPLPRDRKGCEHFCRNIVNCAAVDWHSLNGRCQFHHVPKELTEANGVTHYTVEPCLCSIQTCGTRIRSPEFVKECNRYVAAKIDGS